MGVTDDGLELSGSAVRRMACDCDLIRVLLDADGCVLDVGRTQRLVTPAIWTALVARDHHCAFPGCTRPPVMCHAHHIRHWADGGATSLDNLVLLCGHHHRTIHHTPWQVRLGRRPTTRVPAAAETGKAGTGMDPVPASAGVTRPFRCAQRSKSEPESLISTSVFGWCASPLEVGFDSCFGSSSGSSSGSGSASGSASASSCASGSGSAHRLRVVGERRRRGQCRAVGLVVVARRLGLGL